MSEQGDNTNFEPTISKSSENSGAKPNLPSEQAEFETKEMEIDRNQIQIDGGYSDAQNERLSWLKKRTKLFTQPELPPEVGEVLLGMTKKNMEPIYKVSEGWDDWDDAKKREEILNCQETEYIVLFDEEVNSSIESTNTCNAIPESKTNPPEEQVVAASDNVKTSELGKPIAFAAVQSISEFEGNATWKVLHINELQVSDSSQRKGFGQWLLDQVLEFAMKRKSPAVVLTALLANEGSLRFYKRNSFDVDEACPSFCYQSEKMCYRILSKPVFPRKGAHYCGFCEVAKPFRFIEGLITHKCLEHHEPWPYRCRQYGCGAGTAARWHYQQHLMLHDDEHPLPMKRPRKSTSRYIERI